MKNTILLIGLLILAGCTPEKNEFIELNEDSVELTMNNRSNANAPSYSQNQLVVKFRPNTPENKKIQARLEHEVINYKTCECADDTIELWTFDMTNSTIEGNLGEIVVDPDLEGGEYQYFINTSNSLFNNANSNIAGQIAITKSANTGVTIAVIDSGLDYNYKGFNTPFLFNTKKSSSCQNKQGMKDISGWDFVNNDNNIYDDNGHGTVVTYLMVSELRDAGTDFQVLPIKAFDQNGLGNYFDVLCSFQYAANNPSVDIINMSFGWYYEPFVFLGQFITEASDKLLVTSAGNLGYDTEEYVHYPSSYENSHIVSVASMNQQLTGLFSESNFGSESVDVAALGESIEFFVGGGSFMVNGTSFSNSFVSARAAQQYVEGIQPENLKNSVISTGYSSQNLVGLLVNPVFLDD